LWEAHRQQRRRGSGCALMTCVNSVNQLHETAFIQQKCRHSRVPSCDGQTVDCSFKKSIPTSDQIVDSGYQFFFH
jgi:hypothetical protein